VALTLPADAGEPLCSVLIARSKVQHHTFTTLTRQVSLRNTGTNTLWLSLDDGKSWFDVACGTSWDDRVSLRELWYRTQLGRTRFVVIGLALIDPVQPAQDDRSERERADASRAKRRWLPSRQNRR
jgi:hypothetical protein